jgi:RNA polymerase-binding transcription factor DksA
MIITEHVEPASNHVVHGGGMLWNRLHSERENVCEKLLSPEEPGAANDRLTRREELELRLRQLDNALDRLMTGRYGECSRCGRWIEDTKLAADPAWSFCVECQHRLETKHQFPI